VWRHLSLQANLEACGFCTTVPIEANIRTNDKLAAVLSQRMPNLGWLQTLRVPARNFFSFGPAAPDLDYPVLVKPANWGSGNAVHRAENQRELEVILQLASASQSTMIVQPWLGYDTRDVRIYCVDGEPLHSFVRIPPNGSLVANYGMGGSYERFSPPVEILTGASAIATDFNLPYVCVDYLHADGNFWLSEIELDGGAVGYMAELEKLKFVAWRRHFDRFVAGQTGMTTGSTAG
jgi:glutathione synthase/RimK-type ligase-like ATP-grasp enzyme